MPSIFEKPSLLGFRQKGGAVDTPYTRASRAWTSPIGSVKPGTLTINPLDSVPTEGGLPQWLARNIPAGVAGLQDFVENAILSPAIYAVSGYDTGESAQKEKILREMGYGVDPSVSEGAAAIANANDTYENEAYALPPSTTPLAQSMFARPSAAEAALAAANETYEAEANALPPSPSMFSAPTGTRAERIAAAKASGDFETKRTQYNQEAMRMGSPTMMDEQGNIVGRELTQNEQMREFFNRTGGNTPFMQTNDPAQRALQNEMMKQARGQMAANTFGTTPEERRANLEAEVEARRILASPLNGDGVRDMGNGVRGAFKDGQVVGFSTPGDGVNVPKGMMKDPITGEEIPVALYNEMTRQTQATKGMTGGSPMERGLIAAMAAEEARKKKLADDARKAALAAMPPTNEAELIARTPAVTIAPREAAAPKPPPPMTPLKDILGSAVMWDVDPDTGKKLSKPQKMIW